MQVVDTWDDDLAVVAHDDLVACLEPDKDIIGLLVLVHLLLQLIVLGLHPLEKLELLLDVLLLLLLLLLLLCYLQLALPSLLAHPKHLEATTFAHYGHKKYWLGSESTTMP